MQLLGLLLLAVAVAGGDSPCQESEGAYGPVQHGASPTATPVMICNTTYYYNRVYTIQLMGGVLLHLIQL